MVKGWIKRADAAREFASLIGIAPGALETSVERYNSIATDGEDIDFNRKPNRIAAIRSPPYYAMALTPSFIKTEAVPGATRTLG